MPKHYSVRVDRYITVDKHDGVLKITVAKSGSDNKIAAFPSKRWVNLTHLFGQIDEFQPVDGETERRYEATNRWKMVRISRNRIQLRGSTGVVLPPNERCETHSHRYRSTSQQVADTGGGGTTNIRRIPHSDYDFNVPVST